MEPTTQPIGLHHVRSADPAEALDFGRLSERFPHRFDGRGDRELEKQAFDAESDLERERAIWELADRRGSDVVHLLQQMFKEELTVEVRKAILWLLLQVGAPADELALHTDDADVALADWARCLLADLTGSAHKSLYRQVSVSEAGAFDQTLPLMISGSVLVEIGTGEYARVALSPLWFESIMGRVLACTNQSTIRTDLVIEKRLEGLHLDGSAHFELFKFRGLTAELGNDRFEHTYQSLSNRRFYPSGVVEDGWAVEVPVELARIAVTEIPAKTEAAVVGSGPRAKRLKRSERPFVQSVRGRYSGWASVNLDRILSEGEVRAGTVQLSTPTDPIAGPMTNARLFGIFRGTLGNQTGEGDQADLNAIPCHGTVDGVHDLHMDGTQTPDPFAS
jgi:hypothetical protein